MRTAQIVVLGIVVAILIIGYLGYRQSHPQLINECDVDSDCSPGQVCKQPITSMSLMAVADEHPGLGRWCVDSRKCSSDEQCERNNMLPGCYHADTMTGAIWMCDKDFCFNDDDCTTPQKCIFSEYFRPKCNDLFEAKENCERLGGDLRQICLGREWSCVMDAYDAGKACTDSDQCKYGCITAPDLSTKTTIGTPASGECASNSDPCGCSGRIEDGKYEGTLCVD